MPSNTLHYFGDYELLHEIARGGMGVVYKAKQVSLNRIVAVKMLLFGKLVGSDFIKRFHAEAAAAASLQHPNIVAIHEVGEHEGQHYFSMDYVEGVSLADLVREKALPARRAAGLLKAIAAAIHYAHQHGILHRDLKPSNVLMDANDQPHITDFGLAKRLQCESDLTVTGQMVGTPHFMPPEQAGGRRNEVTRASDVYSLGAILYHLLTGRPPFLADTFEAVLGQLLHAEPVAPRLLNPAVPLDLETICIKCLNKDPRRRYLTAEELSDELSRYLEGKPIHARPVSRTEKVWRWCRRKPALAMLALVAVAGVFGILWQWQRAEMHARNESAQRHRAEQTLTRLELQIVENWLEKDETAMGIADLARIVREHPTNRIASQRLMAALTQRQFALPVGPPLAHRLKVNHAEFSPDGRRVVTASRDFSSRVWDARTGKPLTESMIHRDAVRFAHFSPDGRRILTVTDDFQARLWDATTGQPTGQPMQHSQKIWSAQFSPDGRRVLTSSSDGTAQVWDAQSGLRVLKPFTHRELVRQAFFSPDGTRIVTASDDKSVQFWDAETGLATGSPFQHAEGVVSAAFSPDGKWLATGAGISVSIWDVDSGKLVGNPLAHSDHVMRVRFSPDGRRIFVVLSSGRMPIWDARSWEPISLTKPLTGVISIEFSPDGQHLLTASDYTALLWDINSGKLLSSPRWVARRDCLV